MKPKVVLENGKMELIREILGVKDIHDIDLLNEFKKVFDHCVMTDSKKETKKEVYQ